MEERLLRRSNVCLSTQSELIKNMFDRGRTLESIAEDVNMSVEEVGRLLNLEKAE